MLLELLKEKWKYVASLILCVACLIGGYQYGIRSVKPTVLETVKTIEVEKIVTKEVIVYTSKKSDKTDKVTVITKNKDGSQTTVITDKSTSTTDVASNKTSEKASESSKTSEKTESLAKGKISKYSLGLTAYFDANPKIFQKLDPHYGVTAGARVIGGLWADTEYRIHSKSVSLGLRYEF